MWLNQHWVFFLYIPSSQRHFHILALKQLYWGEKNVPSSWRLAERSIAGWERLSKPWRETSVFNGRLTEAKQTHLGHGDEKHTTTWETVVSSSGQLRCAKHLSGAIGGHEMNKSKWHLKVTYPCFCSKRINARREYYKNILYVWPLDH